MTAMQAASPHKDLQKEEVSVERAVELSLSMGQDKQEILTQNMSIFIGDLPHYGQTIILIPTLGQSVLLFSN